MVIPAVDAAAAGGLEDFDGASHPSSDVSQSFVEGGERVVEVLLRAWGIGVRVENPLLLLKPGRVGAGTGLGATTASAGTSTGGGAVSKAPVFYNQYH